MTPTIDQWSGTDIRAVRIARGWSLEELAARVREAPATVERWEAGEPVPSWRLPWLAVNFKVKLPPLQALKTFTEKAPWFPEFLDWAMPTALLEFAPYWRDPIEAKAHADRLTVNHQMRLGITTAEPDFDSWDGEGPVPMKTVPVATGLPSLLGAMAEGLVYGVPRDKRGLGERSAQAVARTVVTLAGLTRALAVLALANDEPVNAAGRSWSRHDEVVQPVASVEGLAAKMVDALHQADDDAFFQRLIESNALEDLTIPPKSWIAKRLAEMKEASDDSR